jgi:site-specific recombinase XerD
MIELGLVDLPLVAPLRVKVPSQSHIYSDRFLSVDDMRFVNEAIDIMPHGTDSSRKTQARARWLIFLAMETGLRTSEMTAVTSGMIEKSKENSQYNLNVRVENQLVRVIPLAPTLVTAYRNYLESVDVSFPPKVDMPLLLPIRNCRSTSQSTRQLTRQFVWREIRGILRAAAILASAAKDEGASERLKVASAFWLRRFRAVQLLQQGISLSETAAILGQASVATTAKLAYPSLLAARRANLQERHL